MNNPERQKDIFDAITGIDDDLIQEAAAPRTRPFPRRLVRIAAIAAVLAILMTALLWPDPNYITGPGIFVVRACAAEAQSDKPVQWTDLETGVVFTPDVQYFTGMSRIQRFPFSFFIEEKLYPNMDISLEVTTNSGIFSCVKSENNQTDFSVDSPPIVQLVSAYSGQHFFTDSDSQIMWEPIGFDYNHAMQEIEKGNFEFSSAYKSFNFETGPAYIDIIIRADEYIVGYCVIEIQENGTTMYDSVRKFSFELLAMVSFPAVDGHLQSISEHYVTTQLQKIHKES